MSVCLSCPVGQQPLFHLSNLFLEVAGEIQAEIQKNAVYSQFRCNALSRDSLHHCYHKQHCYAKNLVALLPGRATPLL